MSAARAYNQEEGADLAWRAGLIHYLRGDSRAALAVFDRATR
jgi:hypothetical protein